MVVILQLIIYRVIQVVFLPATIIAAIILNYKALIVSKKYNVDYTAEKVLLLRCKMHLLGVRKDVDSFSLYQALPIASVFSLRLLVSPTILSNKITGYRPVSMTIPDKQKASIFQYIYVRTFEFDRILEENIGDVEQFVVMGAGYDLRAQNSLRDKGIKVYELDQAPIQQLKKQCLRNIGLHKDWITYVPVDFNKELWSNKLLDYGWDPNKKTFFLWEGVASYLDETVVINTLNAIQSISQHESIISFDYNSTSYNKGKGTLMEKIIVRLMGLTGKVFLFGIDTTNAKMNAELFLQKSDLRLLELTLIGQNTESVSPFSGLVLATTRIK